MSSGVELYSEPNQDVLITGQLGYSDTGLYLKALIYDIQDLTIVIDTLYLDEIGEGAYAKKWTNPGALTKYWVRIFVYTDAGYTTISDIDRPAEISINIGRYQGGGYLGGTGGKVIRTSLTEEEIEKIAKRVKEILQPELDKKSEFNPKSDIVKTEDKIIDNSELLTAISGIKMPTLPEIPRYDETRVITEVLKAIKQIKTSDYSRDLNEIKILISKIKPSEVKMTGVEALLDPLKYYLLLMSMNDKSSPESIFKGIKNLNGIWKKKAFLELIKYPNLAKQVAKL